MKSLVALLLMFSPAVFAQAPRDFYPWWDSPVVKDLGLSEDQHRRVRETVHEYRLKLVDLRAAVEKAEIGFGDAFNEENFDMRKAMDASDRLAKARGELSVAFSQMSVKLRAVLTAQQWKELQKRRPQQHMRQQRNPGMRGPQNPQGPQNPMQPRMGPGMRQGMQPGMPGMPGMRQGMAPNQPQPQPQNQPQQPRPPQQ